MSKPRAAQPCAITTTWPEIPPNGVRLACCLPAGHDGDHACAEIEYMDGES